MKLAMAVGATNHYRIEGIQRRHFVETAGAAGLSKSAIEGVIEEIVESADDIMARLAHELPLRFPKRIHASVSKAVVARLRTLSADA
jgi:serine/threonine-protein kinase HipA